MLKPSQSKVETARPGPRPVIIVVDDSEVCREIAEYLLTDMGYEVISVADPLSLADALRASRPVLVLADYNMPRMNGDEMLKVVKADGALSCPFVLHSDRSEDELEVIAARCGADGYVRKTADAEKMRRALEPFLPRA
jgi:CheY-like chemotaxis protein